jgi:hypothetical protein
LELVAQVSVLQMRTLMVLLVTILLFLLLQPQLAEDLVRQHPQVGLVVLVVVLGFPLLREAQELLGKEIMVVGVSVVAMLLFMEAQEVVLERLERQMEQVALD